MKKQILFGILLAGIQMSYAQMTKIWEIDSVCRGAECVVYDTERNCLYVSNFNTFPGDGSLYNSDHIVKVSIDGKVLEDNFVHHLTAPTGMCIFHDRLFIVERFGVVVYNLQQNRIETRYRICGGGFLNDICADDAGTLYVTDSDSAAIYRINNSSVEQWLKSPDIAAPNGILCDGKDLIIGVNGDNYLKSISISDKKITPLALMGEGIIDGIKKHGDDYFVSLFLGNLYLVRKDGRCEELLNTRSQKINCADFEYIDHLKMFIIPSIQTSTVTAYTYTQ